MGDGKKEAKGVNNASTPKPHPVENIPMPTNGFQNLNQTTGQRIKMIKRFGE